MNLDMFMFLITIAVFSENVYNNYAFRVVDVNGVETILALEHELINIECKQDMQMAYCGFVHPKGKRFSFSGLPLADGHCAVKINATKDDTGDWRCHTGRKSTGLELIQSIKVRVVDQLAAVQPNVTAVHGKAVTLECITTKAKMPLSYCRFEPPNGSPFNIDPDVTPTNPILGKYYFPQNKSLNRGDCAVTIRKVKYQDVGLWTCGAGLDDGKEHIDVLKLDVEGLYTISTASATGIAFGGVGIAVFLLILGVVAWKKRRVMGTARNPEVREEHELEERPRVERSPQTGRNIPSVVVQSPSVSPSASPLMPQ